MDAPPLIRDGAIYTDPLPQALVLTAIVIGLGTTALMLAYAFKLYEKRRTLDIDKFTDLRG